MRVLLESGIDPCTPDISRESLGPCFGASALHTEVSESIFCLQVLFECQTCGPLAREDSATKQLLDVTQSFDVVFSSDRSSDRFTGKPVSQTTGLYYYYRRWYDPSIGRFISPDPKQGKLFNPQSLNLYIYVLDDPTTLQDPSGLDWWNPFTWTQQQQAQAFTIAVIVVAVVAVVATGGLASPIALAAVGAALSTTTYTVTAGNKATLGGAVVSATIGAIGGGTAGIVAGAAGALGLGSGASFALGMAASFVASSGVQKMLGLSSTDSVSRGLPDPQKMASDNMQLLQSLQSQSSMGGGGSDRCKAGIAVAGGAALVGLVLLEASTWILHASDGDSRVEALGFGVMAAGIGLPVAGGAYAVSQCAS